jgi:hypothetical protein
MNTLTLQDMSIVTITTELETITRELVALKDQGEYLQGVTITYSRAGGTASEKAQRTPKYAQLRARGQGKRLPSGKVSQYIPLKEIPTIAAMVERGQKITKLETAIARLQAKLSKLQEKIAKIQG